MYVIAGTVHWVQSLYNANCLGSIGIWRIIDPGVTLIFSYIQRLGPFFGVQNFEFQHFWGISEKNIFGGLKNL